MTGNRLLVIAGGMTNNFGNIKLSKGIYIMNKL